MTMWHAHVVHMVKHINMVVGPLLNLALGLHQGRYEK